LDCASDYFKANPYIATNFVNLAGCKLEGFGLDKLPVGGMIEADLR
jgi:hypothetical protein